MPLCNLFSGSFFLCLQRDTSAKCKKAKEWSEIGSSLHNWAALRIRTESNLFLSCPEGDQKEPRRQTFLFVFVIFVFWWNKSQLAIRHLFLHSHKSVVLLHRVMRAKLHCWVVTCINYPGGKGCSGQCKTPVSNQSSTRFPECRTKFTRNYIGSNVNPSNHRHFCEIISAARKFRGKASPDQGLQKGKAEKGSNIFHVLKSSETCPVQFCRRKLIWGKSCCPCAICRLLAD